MTEGLVRDYLIKVIEVDGYEDFLEYEICTPEDFPMSEILAIVLQEVADVCQEICVVTLCVEGEPRLFGRYFGEKFIPYIFNAEHVGTSFWIEDASGEQITDPEPEEPDYDFRYGSDFETLKYHEGDFGISSDCQDCNLTSGDEIYKVEIRYYRHREKYFA